MSAAADAHRADLAADDLRPTCPRCQALCTDGAKWCGECDTWLMDRGPTASELAERMRLRRDAVRRALLAGDAAPPGEATTATKGSGE